LDGRLVRILRRRLTALRYRVKNQLAEMEAGMMDSPQSEWSGELSAYDNHPADSASETYQREQQVGLIDSRRRILSMIEHVIAKMDDGTYGLCENCRCEIPAERLEAIPYALLCKECREAQEAETVSHLRPPEESLISDLFARLFSGGEDFVGTDGEDVWHDVAKYGTSGTYQDVAGTATADPAAGIETIEGTDSVTDGEDHDI
jgi:YteA family regulatory protein